MTAVLDKKALMRDKRAQGIAAMGLVNREGDRFRVTTPTLRGRRASYEVWRDEAGRVRCTCLEFEEQSAQDPRYRCEHILAVKHAVLNKNTEAAAKQQAAQKVSAPQAQGATPENVVAAETPNTLTQPASEKLGEAAAEATLRAPRKAPRFVREQNEQPEPRKAEVEIIVAAETPQRSLAEHEETEELEMTKKATAHVQKAEEEQDFITAEEYEQQTTAPVVPLSFAKTLGTLKQPVDPRLIKTREGWRDRNGNQHMVEYVEWHTVADILDRVAPTWSHAVRGIVQIGDMVAVTAAITIDGVTREGVGTGNADNETGIKKAEHDALKRAAIKFGIARELYQRESDVIEREGSGPQPGDFPKDPLAKSMADLVTPKQLGMIRALAREAGVDPDEESQQVMRVRTEELSKRAASSFIDHLKGLGREQTFEVRRAS
ncbi:MAG TPA: Rad52/Rad22 family DNA repair protein [Pyrinomonadaceae bacterium]|nr:Rad52/Rad22 family DNA repair protein [Pyrinomonadaceae bacterium]